MGPSIPFRHSLPPCSQLSSTALSPWCFPSPVLRFPFSRSSHEQDRKRIPLLHAQADLGAYERKPKVVAESSSSSGVPWGNPRSKQEAVKAEQLAHTKLGSSTVTKTKPTSSYASAPRPPFLLVEPAFEPDFLQALQDQQLAAEEIHQQSLLNSSADSTPADVSANASLGNFFNFFSAPLRSSTQPKPKALALVAMFTAEWCGPCTLLHKEIARMPGVFSEPSLDLRILVLDVEDNAELASRLRIKSLPTLLFIGPDTQKPPLASTGFIPRKQISDIVRSKVIESAGCNLKAKAVFL